jgi:hypothetical protein
MPGRAGTNAGDKDSETLRLPFETSSIEGLSEWASGLGRWLFV